METPMSIAVQLDFQGATLEQYEQGLEITGLLPGGPGPRMQIFHCVVETAEGIRVIDVWESREAYEKFASTNIRPVAEAVGMPNPPRVQLFDVHNLFTARRRS
jgi:hypothetical protein